ncbi:MAG: hypothetical protein HY525_12820 [Betaproteobacteria bacterium]|nr:hypothetical protein [Betaproteobacteria bacterium]
MSVVSLGRKKGLRQEQILIRAQDLGSVFFMQSSCGRCSGWTGSLEDVLAILNGEWSACEDCAHKEVMRVVAKQFRSRQPQWWVVNGKAVIPIWIVERLRNRYQNG